MREILCDVAIIGAGTAGLAAREAASKAGARTVLIEAGVGGTTCARVGCMPSKLLIAAANAAHASARIELFGLQPSGPVQIDGPAVMDRVRRERDRFVGSVRESVDDIPADDRLAGQARFVGPTTLSVEGVGQVQARAVVIATGAISAVPKPLRDLGDLILTNETVFELPDLPVSLAVVGAGPLGLELALAFRRLGVRVTVFDEGATLAGLVDPAIEDLARDLLGREVEIVLGAKVTGRRVGAGAEIAWDGEGGTGTAVFDKVLVAAGRPPNLDGLDLAYAGLTLDDHGTPVFDRATMQCGTSPVFIAGDCDHDRPVLHEASDEGRIAGRNAALFPKVERFARQVPLAITYTDPEIAVIGAPWPQIEDEAVVGEADLSRSGRARVMGRNAGLLRLYGRRHDGKLLGGAMIGPQVEHLAHLLAWCVQLGLTADDALALPFYHPTLEESLRTALRDLCGKAGSRVKARARSMEYASSS